MPRKLAENSEILPARQIPLPNASRIVSRPGFRLDGPSDAERMARMPSRYHRSLSREAGPSRPSSSLGSRNAFARDANHAVAPQVSQGRVVESFTPLHQEAGNVGGLRRASTESMRTQTGREQALSAPVWNAQRTIKFADTRAK
jgi:hypothetical protein